MLKFHFATGILKPPDQAGDVIRPVQPVEVIGAQVLADDGLAAPRRNRLGPEVAPEYGLIIPILGHSVAKSIPGALLHAPGPLRTDEELFSMFPTAGLPFPGLALWKWSAGTVFMTSPV
jgi:hypothetical protein